MRRTLSLLALSLLLSSHVALGGTFITDTAAPTLFTDKAPAPGQTLRPGWGPQHVFAAADANALKGALLDVRTDIRGREFNVKHYGAAGNGTTDDTAAIRAAITAAGAASSGGVVFPPGTYRTTGTLSLPLAANGRFSLDLTGATLAYEGTGRALEAVGAAQPYVNLAIRGGRVVGTSAGTAGLYLSHFNKARVEGTSFEGFTTGDGILNEGANAITLVDVQVKGNRIGLHNVGKHRDADGIDYQGNAVAVLGGHFAFNSLWGYHSDGAGSVGGTVPNIGNSFHGVTFEYNGTGGVGGHMKLDATDSESIISCYFEDSATLYGQAAIVLGDSVNPYTARSTQILANWFGGATGGTTIQLARAAYTNIQGNNEVGAVASFVNAEALATSTALGPNMALAAASYTTGAGTFAINLRLGTSTLGLTGNVTAANVVRATNTAQGLFYATNDTILRSATGGTTRMQDQVGTTQANFTSTEAHFPGLLRLGSASGPTFGFGTAAPTTGTWAAGSVRKNSAPAVGSPKGWVCTVAGTPGTWVSEGNL